MGLKKTSRSNYLTVGKETTFATPAEPTEFIRETGFSGGMRIEYVESQSHSGSRFTSGNIKTSGIGNLSIPFEADGGNLQFFLHALMGQDTVSANGTAFDHEFEPTNDSTLPSWTIETGYGDFKFFRNAGAVLNSLSLDISPKSIISGTAEFIFKDEIPQATKTALTPATTRPMVYADAFIRINGSLFGEVKSASFNFNNNLDSEDFRLNNAGQIASLSAGAFSAGGSMQIVYNEDSLSLRDAYLNGTEVAVEIEIITNVPAGDTNESLILSLPRVQLSSGDIDSSESLMVNADFTAFGGVTAILTNAEEFAL